MNSDDKFWLSLWVIAGVIVISVELVVCSYYKDKNAQIVDAIKFGSDPIEVVCAMDNQGGYSQICTILAE